MEFIFIVIDMKSFFILFTLLLFNLTFINPSFGEWRLVVNGSDGNQHYIDTKYVKRENEIVYFKRLINYLKLNNGYLSEISHIKGDCNLYRKKDIKISIYKHSMGRGQSEDIDLSQYSGLTDWKYLKPKSVTYVLLNIVCKNS